MTDRSVRGQVGLLCIVCSLGLSQGAPAQTTTYSADSLIASFQKGSQTSPKGTPITFTGVIAEIKKSSVTFKSSTNDKVICEMTPSTDQRKAGLSVGSPLTVVGKVRGRGILGNVTLDECRLPPSVVVSNEHPPAPEPSHEQSEVEPAAHVDEPKDQPVEAPVVEAPAPVAADVPAISPSRPKPATKTGAIAAPLADRASPSEPQQPLPTTSEREQPREGIKPGETTKQDSNPVPFTVAFTAFAGLLIGVAAHMVFVKMRRSRGAAFRPSLNETSNEDARRAALERLLLGQKKKR